MKESPIYYKKSPMKKNYLLTGLLVGLFGISQTIQAQATYTFSTAGATGRTGPTQAQVNTAYTSTNLSGSVTIGAFQGIQQFTIPVAGIYSITAMGAGVNGGFGAKLSGTFNFPQGQVLYVAVGQQALTSAGGHGGSFVSTGASVGTSTPLIVAGGGGGNGGVTGVPQNSAAYTTSGNPGDVGFGGINGFGGQCNTNNSTYGGGGGGGFYGDGVNTSQYSLPGSGFINGAAGGDIGSSFANTTGGFGGGGSGHTGLEPGGGGGYSGGGGGGANNQSSTGVGSGNRFGGGGGSYNSGVIQSNLAITNTSDGKVIMSYVYNVTIAQTATIACNGQSTAALLASVTGGVGPYTYTWQPGNTHGSSTSGLGAGIYTVSVTDANLLVTTNTFVVTQPSALSTSTAVTTVLCNGGTGSATITASGGTGGYTYLWSNGATAFSTSGIPAGAYTATVTDANSCTSIKNATITQPTALVTSTAVTSVLCNGGTGSATITASGGAGGYAYLWSNGATTTTNTGLLAGAYTATVTDANSCTSIKNATITQPTALVTSTAVASVLCNGGSTGSATITASGGTGGYTYLWSNGVTTFSNSGIPAGAYTATVTDANSCTSIKNATITQPTALVTSTAVASVLCNGGSTGSATIIATGGTGGYAYLWSNGVTTFSNSGIPAGAYTATVTDANLCTSIKNATITQPTVLTPGTSSSAILCNGGMSTVTVSATGGSPAYLGTGTYTAMAGTNSYTVSDANGCTATASVNILQPAAIVSSQTLSICIGQSVTVGANTYTTTGVYTNTFTAINTCDSTVTTHLIVNPLPTVTINSGVICAGKSFTMTPGGAVTYTYSSGSNTVTPTANTSYTVNGTDANGCKNTAVSSVTVNAIPTLTATTNHTLICVGEASTLTVSGATTYTWNATQHTAQMVVTPTTTTTYTVNGTNANGCSNLATITQSVSLCTGIETVSNHTSFMQVYPNPNNGLFTVELTETSLVSITNAIGAEVMAAETMEQGKHTFDLHNEACGIYFVKVIQGNKQQVMKLIKQ